MHFTPGSMEPRSTVQNDPDVTLIIVSYNTAHLLEPLFEAIDASRASLRLQIIVVDNASRDNSVEILRTKFPDVELIESASNVGFGRANNLAVSKARGRYILLLNTDAFISPDTLVKTIGYMDQNPDCGVLGVKLVGRDGWQQPSCRYFPTPWNRFLASTALKRFFPGTRLVDEMSWDHGAVRECDWVPGCYYLTRRSIVDRIGLFDPRFFLYCEEIDHCQRVKRAGWRVIYYPFTSIVHLGGESAKSDSTITGAGRQNLKLKIESELLYFRKNLGLSGLIQAVLLSIFADILKGGKGIFRLDFPALAVVARHLGAMFGVLFQTRLASKPSR
jgi:N-acetylglucosaminyl-diphospho-decaprenol L-rhamnosyltransferase